MSWRIHVGGKLQFDAELEQISEQLNDHEEATFYIPNNEVNRSSVSANTDVSIYFFGNLIFYGTLAGLEYEKTRIKCQVYNKAYELLNKKAINKPTEYEAGVAANTILSDVVAATAGTSAGVCPTDTIAIVFNRTMCYDAMEFISDATNKDFWTTLGGTVINIGTRGSDKGRINVTNVGRRGINRAKKRDKVEIRGVAADGTSIVGSAGAGTDIAVFTEKKAKDLTTLNSIAAKKLAELNKDTSGVSITCNLNEVYDVYPGDTVTIIDAEFNLNGAYRVEKTVKKRDGTAQLEVDKSEELLQRFLEKQQNLEDLGIYAPTALETLDDPAGAPATPSGLTVSTGPLGVRLAWTANTEADLQRYRVYRHTSFASGSSTGIRELDANSYTDYPPATETYYWYWIRAEDRVGNLSPYFPTAGPGVSGKYQLIKTTTISNSAIDNDKILNDAVTELKIAASSVSHNRIKINAIWGSVISAAAITRQKIGVSAITSGVMAAKTITRGQMYDATITSGVIAAGQINRTLLGVNSITSGIIAASTIKSRNIIAGGITSEKIAASSITAGKIGAGSIQAINIAASQVTAGKLAANAVLAANIAASSIQAGKIAASTIYAFQIRAGSILTEKLAANSIVSAKIAAGEILAINIGASAIISSKIAADAIVANHIAASQIAAMHIVAGAIDTNLLTANAIYGKTFKTASGVGVTKTGLILSPAGLSSYGSGAIKFYTANGVSLRGRIGNAGYTYGSGLEIDVVAGKIISLNAGGGGLWAGGDGHTHIRQHLFPTTGTGYADLGASTKKWTNIYGGTIKGDTISGASITAHFRDAFWADLICPKCDEAFKPGESVGLFIKNVEHSELRTVPVHMNNCNSFIRKLMRKL